MRHRAVARLLTNPATSQLRSIPTDSATRQPWLVRLAAALCVIGTVTMIGCTPSSTSKTEPAKSATTQDAPAKTDVPTAVAIANAAEEPQDSPDYPLPKENTVEKLIEYINMLTNQDPPRDNEYNAKLVKIMEARVLGAQRLGQLDNHEDLQSHVIAAETQLESLRVLSWLDAPTANERRDTYVQTLVKSENEELARIGRIGNVQRQIDQLRSKGEGEPEAVEAAVSALLEKEEKDERLFYATREAAQMLASLGDPDLGLGLLKKVGTAFADNSDKKLAAQGADLLEQIEVMGLQRAMMALGRDEEGGKEQFEAACKQLLDRPTLSGTIVFNTLKMLQQLEYSGQVETARQMYEAIGQVTDKIPDTNVREEVTMRIESASRRLGLVGNPFTVEGVLVDGAPFDWSSYAGKVVLVDFWATWCGPCIAEIPNIRQAYDDFHDQGFEVIGINMDEDLQAAQQFVKDNNIPWATVVAGEGAASGGSNPNAVRCGVEGIPFLVLVGRDGKVVALHTRGPELALQVSQLINEGAAGTEPTATDEPTTPPASDTPASDTPATDTPATDTPATDTPAADTPAAEPAADTPPAEEAADGEPK